MNQESRSPSPATRDVDADVATARSIVADDKATRRKKRRADRAERVADRNAEREDASKEVADMDRARARGIQGVADIVDAVVDAIRELTRAVHRAVDSREGFDDLRAANASLRERLTIVEASIADLKPETTTKAKK